jgi:hypothetical protein
VILTVRICTYVRTYKSTYDLPYVHVCSQLYLQIRAIYVQHTAQIVLYTYTTYHIRTWTYMHVYRTYVHVYDFNVAVCWVDWSRMWMYFQWIRADTDTLLGTPTVRIWTYMYVFVIIRAYTCCTYMHVFLIEIRSVYLPKIRAHAYGHGAVTVALRSPAPAQVSALSPRGCYGKFVARQRKRMQIAKFNHIRSARLISGSWRQLVQACPGQRSCDVGDPLLRHWSWDFSTQLHRNPSTENQRKRSWCYLNNLRMAWHSILHIDLGISRPNCTEIQAQKINANVHGVT